jgi:hypothetical protein
MGIFDYVYYRAYAYYKIKRKALFPGVFAVALLSAVQSLNWLLLFLYEWASGKSTADMEFIDTESALPALVILGLNYWRYTSGDSVFRKFHQKWKNEDPEKREKRGWYVLLYVILTFVLTFGLAIYMGGMKNN